MRQYLQTTTPFKVDASFETQKLSGTDIMWRGKTDGDPTLSSQQQFTQLLVSPDGTKSVCCPYVTGISSVFFCGDLDVYDWTTLTTPGSATIYYIACSDTMFAIAHSSGFSVYDWSGTVIQHFNSGTTPAISSTYAIAISPDGTKLACVDNSAVVRQFDTAAWTYSTAATGTVSTYARLQYNSDGTQLVGQSFSSPYLYKYDTTTLVKTQLSINSSYRCYQAYGAPYYGWIMADHTDPDIMFFACSSSGSSPILLRWDLVGAGVPTHSMGSSGPPNSKYTFHWDKRNSRMILSTGNSYTGSDGQTHYTYTIRGSDLGDLQQLELPVGTSFGVVVADSGLGNIAGTVRDVDNNPAERQIRAFARSDGSLIGETMSDDTTGDYELNLPSSDPVDVQFMALDVELLNDLFFARVVPNEVP